MVFLTDLLMLAGSLLVMAYASKFVLSYSVNIANATKFGDMVFGFIILAVLTNIPEIALAAAAITTGSYNLSVGNLIGGSLYKVTFVVGVMAVIAKLTIRKRALKELSRLLLIVATISTLVIITEIPVKIFGVLLLLFYAIFVWISIKGKLNLEDLRNKKFRDRLKPAWIFGLFVSSVAVIISSVLSVNSAVSLSQSVGISQTVIGASIFAVATNLPEFIIAVRSVTSRHEELGFGTLLGANITNVALILGMVFLFSEGMALDVNEYSTTVAYLLGSSILLWLFFNKGQMGKTEGIVLIAIFATFLLVAFGFTFSKLLFLFS